MKWFDFTDIKFVLFFIIIVVVVAFLAFMIVSVSISFNKDHKYIERMKAESTTLRIYIIDVKNNSVTYFNRSDLRDKRQTDLNAFYSHFHTNDIDKIKAWIFDICTNFQTADKYVEADILVNHGKQTYYSLLKLHKFDPVQGIIHLESIVLKYITYIFFRHSI